MSRQRKRSRAPSSGTARSRAAAVARRVVEERVPADGLLEDGARGLEASDRRLFFELALGTLRWLRRLDWVVAKIADRPLERIDAPVLWTLRVASYQLLFLDRVPAYAAVDEAVREVALHTRGRASGFANAVLRTLARRPSLGDWPVDSPSQVARLGIEHSHPDFLVQRWLDKFGRERAVRLMEANNRPKPTHLLCFADRLSVAAELKLEGVETTADDLSPVGLRVVKGDPTTTESFTRGRFYVQDEASQAAALVPPPRAQERILDLAAAPGGKGFALAAVEPSIRLTSADVSLERALRLRANQRRLGRASPLAVADGRYPACSAVFDRIVADLPCSGTGTIARHPELKWRLDRAGISRLSRRGLEIVLASADSVQTGGLLCIVTCSLEEEENEAVMRQFLLRRHDFEPLPLTSLLAPANVSGVEGIGMWRLLSSSRHDGFTVHVARRRVITV
jgi:16S rRNA (cytosine967-C5)-methyltransferase